MRQSSHPIGPVLTIGMVKEEDRQEIIHKLPNAKDIVVLVDGVSYPVRTVSIYQFGAPNYRRKQ